MVVTTPVDPGRILDAGAGGLRFVTDHLPLLHARGRATDLTAADLRVRYDEQRHLPLQALAEDAAVARTLAARLGRRVDEQHGLLDRLGEAWDGSAAGYARAELRATIAWGAAAHLATAALAVALEAAVDSVAGALRGKAQAMAAFEHVDVEVCPVEDLVTQVEEAIEVLIGACDDTRRAVEDTFAGLAEAVRQVADTAETPTEPVETTSAGDAPHQNDPPPRDAAPSQPDTLGPAAPALRVPSRRGADGTPERAPTTEDHPEPRADGDEGDGVVLAEAGPL